MSELVAGQSEPAVEPELSPAVAAPVIAAHVNGFGALRLILASMVIISHSGEMLDGDQRREPLMNLFGHVSFGGLAVAGFFLISGYLIPASFARSPSSYFWKRILRIYPAYLLCCLLCVLVAAPLAGARLGELAAGDWLRLGYRTLMLKVPDVRGVFVGLPVPTLNGSMWTISYEFRCYLLVALFGLVGLYKRPRVFVALTAAVCAVYLSFALPAVQAMISKVPGPVEAVTGDPIDMVRLLATFMCGTCFWLMKPTLKGRVALPCFIVMLLGFFVPYGIADVGVMTAGAYAMFWLALHVRRGWLTTLNAKDDISYGVYLYAWPVGVLTIWFWRDVPLVLLMVWTLIAALTCGWLSWHFLEKPALSLKSLRFGAERG